MYLLKTLVILNFLNYSQSYFFQKCTSFSSTSNNKTTITSNGAVKGECYQASVSYANGSKVAYDIFTWLGIPFAQAPVGANRFLKPKPVESWTHVRNALEWPKACIQTRNQSVEQSEDCLHLNVFARDATFLNKENVLKPIMIWIHGGAFEHGYSSDNLYEPSTLVATSDVIVVSFNYRLGVFGFLSLENTEASGNAGFLDQHMAIKWVYENAKYFGGDNTKITLFGQDAGALSVGYHLFYPESWPYFRNGIMQSGSPTGFSNFDSKTDASNIAIDVLKELNCNVTTNIERLSCVQKVDANKLVSASLSKPFRFVIDDIVFNKSIEELARENKFKKCNIISGFVSDEYGYILPLIFGQGNFFNLQAVLRLNYTEFYNTLRYIFQVSNETIQGIYSIYDFSNNLSQLQNQTSQFYLQKLIQIGGDSRFICPAFDISEIWTQNGLKAYVYEYKYKMELFGNYASVLGVGHGSEIPVVFAEALSNKDSPLLPTVTLGIELTSNHSRESKRFTEKVIEYWTNFAKYDDPNSLKPSMDSEYWQPFAESSINLDILTAQEKLNVGRYLLMENSAIRTSTGFSTFKCDFWNYTTDGESIPTTTRQPTATTTTLKSGSDKSIGNDFSFMLFLVNCALCMKLM